MSTTTADINLLRQRLWGFWVVWEMIEVPRSLLMAVAGAALSRARRSLCVPVTFDGANKSGVKNAKSNGLSYLNCAM